LVEPREARPLMEHEQVDRRRARARRRKCVPAALGAAILGLTVVTTTPGAQTTVMPIPAPGPAEDEPEFATPTTLDGAGRIVAAVHIGEHGPFRFIVDTGANRTAISMQTAAHLDAEPAEQTIVHGITGSAVMPQVQVDEFRVGELRFHDQRLAILPDAVFGGLDGILGIDALQDARLDIDFVRDQVVVRRSAKSSPGGRAIIRASVRHKGLLMIPARVGRVRVKAIIDTGAERSLGNGALFGALSRSSRVPYELMTSTVVGATAQVATGQTLKAPPIDLGGTRIGNLLITFGDFHVFRIWSLLDEPALVLGMDVLGTLPQFSIDYPRREFQPVVTRRLPPVYTSSDSTP
jgi:predicted aspartyl protease